MLELTPTTASITRRGPNSVTYTIPTTPTTPKTTIRLPPKSKWTSGLHWHEYHTEYLCLIQGSVFVRLGNVVRILSVKREEETKVVTVDRGVRHEWGRAVVYTQEDNDDDNGEDAVVEEWTDPADGEKALFFWNLNGIISKGGEQSEMRGLQRWLRVLLREWWIPFQLFIVFYSLDNWPVFLDLCGPSEKLGLGLLSKISRLIESVITHSILLVTAQVGALFGIKAVNEERTPEQLWKHWRSKHKRV